MNLMNDLMLDIETLSTSIPSPIISIAAAFFDINTGEIGATYYSVIKLESALQHGELEAKTLQWWFKQSDDARSIFNSTNAIELNEALITFSTFLKEHASPENVKIWGNGACFDNVILANAYNKTGLPIPWSFKKDRDVRTIVDLCIRIKEQDPTLLVARTGTPHNALDDVIHQVKYVTLAYNLLNK